MRLLGVCALVLLTALLIIWVDRRMGKGEEAVKVLDPAQVSVIRTPGGMLEVATLQKIEPFAWQASYTCPIINCGALGKTTSEVKVRAHITYRILLSKEWTLKPMKDHYELEVPALEVKTPIAFDTQDMQIRTEQGTWFSPNKAANQEAVVRHLVPALNKRAVAPEYIHLAEQSAATTVAEFAQKWMFEQQGKSPKLPITVKFGRPEVRGI
ncbi:MAG: hypothetical protein IV097_00360 [Burkholderiaceae bacterium]|nr:hypothetical protein [Burkholderiaceae bacterium]